MKVGERGYGIMSGSGGGRLEVEGKECEECEKADG